MTRGRTYSKLHRSAHEMHSRTGHTGHRFLLSWLRSRRSKRQYGIILPGIISFLSYPGSILFLILSCFLIHFFCSFIEFGSRKFSYNSIIFSNFIGFVLGYRLIHFGYLPKQSYLIICAIFLTIFITFILKKLIINFYKI